MILDDDASICDPLVYNMSVIMGKKKKKPEEILVRMKDEMSIDNIRRTQENYAHFHHRRRGLARNSSAKVDKKPGL